VPRGAGRKEATLADVAAAVGLSQAAVSLALRGKSGVSEATRIRVVEASRSLGYRPVSSDSRPHHNKPLTVTLVIRTLHGNAPDANRFYGPVLAGIEESCRRRHLRLMLAIMPVDEFNYPIEVPRAVTDHPGDGLIFLGAHFTPTTSHILEGAPPAVLVDAYSDDCDFDSVETDNVAGARTAIEDFIARGHREIAILGTEPHSFPSILQRRQGYEQALAEAGLTAHYIDAHYYEHEAAAAAAITSLRANPEVTAVFCANDLVAVTFIQAARHAGIAVPNHVSVIGFDDIDLASFISPALTTMAVDKAGMGRLAVTLLLHRLEFEEESVNSTLVRPKLIERETVFNLNAAGSVAVKPSLAARSRPNPEPSPVGVDPRLSTRAR
jgi:LacI family transcriptional regulator, galactose operon repressor